MDNELDTISGEEGLQGTQAGKEKPGYRRLALDILETLFISLVLFFGINLLSARIRVEGSSMEPSLHHGEFLIVNKLAYKIGSPKIGDVVVFHFPGNPEEEFIKRVIGLPGDLIEIAAGRVLVNGQVLNEDYIATPPLYEGEWSVSEGTLFVLGDNRNNSDDSHRWGPVAIDQVVGKAIFVYWPPAEWGVLGDTKPAFSPP
jgi:signal peptidase I